MYGMSEGSLHPIGALRLRSFPSAFKRTLGRLAGRRRRQEKEAAPGPGSSSLAATAIREYAEAHATLFTSLVESLGTSEGGRTFDREVERRYPSFALPGSDL